MQVVPHTPWAVELPASAAGIPMPRLKVPLHISSSCQLTRYTQWRKLACDRTGTGTAGRSFSVTCGLTARSGVRSDRGDTDHR